MTELNLIPAFLLGIAGGIHCVGMCGGIVGSFTFMLPKNTSKWPYMLAYNMGRILSYSVAGALAGYFGHALTSNSFFSPQSLPLLSGIFMVLLGLYIGQWWRILTQLERLGSIVWRRISPLSKRFIPFTQPISALPYGMIWGWLPCGLVYSALTWSISSGGALNGALTMLFFGLGTLPIMLAIGASANTIKLWLNKSMVKGGIAVLIIVYGLLLIVRAAHNW